MLDAASDSGKIRDLCLVALIALLASCGRVDEEATGPTASSPKTASSARVGEDESQRLETWLQERPSDFVVTRLGREDLSWSAWAKKRDKWLDEGSHIPNIESRLGEMLTAGKDTAQRTLIIRALGDLGDWHSYDLLVELMQSKAEPISVRREAIAVVPGLALAHPDGTVAANLETMLLDILGKEGEHVDMRGGAAYGLGILGRPEAVAALVKVASSEAEAPSLRGAACSSLYGLRAPEAVAVLGKVVSEAGDEADEVGLRVGVCSLLASLGGPEAEAYLERAASDPSPAVSGAAAVWLDKLRSGEPLP